MLNYEIHHGKVVKAIPHPGFIIARRYPLPAHRVAWVSPKFDAKFLVGIEFGGGAPRSGRRGTRSISEISKDLCSGVRVYRAPNSLYICCSRIKGPGGGHQSVCD